MNLKKLKVQLRVEVDTAFLYQQLANRYQDSVTKTILQKMAAIENGHAQKVLVKIREREPQYAMPPPSLRAKIQILLGKICGFGFVLSQLAQLEARMSQAEVSKKQAQGEKITGLENVHFNIIQSISKNDQMDIGGGVLSTFEGKHKTIGGNELRAAVLGANDGLVSNMSLVMGVAGASSGHTQILIAGIAGLLAGAISMALGEWISVQSSRELYQRQIEIEAEELENSPEEEMKELALLYQAKGLPEEDAIRIAKDMLSNTETALDSLVREELGIDKDALGGSAYKAAAASFMLFTVGAIIPVSPFFFLDTQTGIPVSIVVSTVGLFLIGSAITLFTGRSVWYSGMRQVIFGLVAAAITYAIGTWLGTTMGL